MEQPEQDEPLDEREREFVAHLARRVREGDEMAEIFGVDEDQLVGLEAQAFRLYRNGQFSRAKIAGRGILALDDRRADVRLMLGDIALEEYRFSEAVEHLEEARRLDPDRLVVRSRLGEALLQRGNVDRARDHLEAVVEAGEEAREDDLERCRVLLRGIGA